MHSTDPVLVKALTHTQGMCKNLVEKGNLDKPLILFNRTQKKADDLASKIGTDKTKVVSSMKEAVDAADIIFTCVGDDKAITDTVNEMISGNVKGKLFVDCSTVHPNTTNQLGKIITGAGAHFVASPVFGAPAMAEGGQLVFVLAGPASDVDKIKPYTKDVMGRENIDYSDQEYGRATQLKIIGNTFILNMVETLAEGHTIAEKTGLGSDNLHQFISTMFPGPYVAYSSRMMKQDYIRDEPLFQVDLAQKDAKHALDLADSSGTKMKAVEVASQHLADVKSIAGEKGDLAGVYGAVRKESGLNYELR